MSWTRIRIVVFLWGCLLPLFALAAIPAQSMSWDQWLAGIQQKALSEGISASMVNTTLSSLKPDPRVLAFSRTQPEKRLSFLQYRSSRGDDYRIKLGVREYKRNAPLLNRIARDYGVSPCAIVSIWGMETSYGRYMGSFPVIRSLATLAYGSERSDYFTEQLMFALRVLNEGHISVQDYKGEWAGASGQAQFMPSSFQNYAVDYDGDGRKNIWTSLPDIFASIANYLAQHGWHNGDAWGYEVKVPSNLGLDTSEGSQHSFSDWRNAGVTLADGSALPAGNGSATLILPEGGPGLLATPNFYVLKAYNNSTYYAGTVSHMANAICQKNGIPV